MNTNRAEGGPIQNKGRKSHTTEDGNTPTQANPFGDGRPRLTKKKDYVTMRSLALPDSNLA